MSFLMLTAKGSCEGRETTSSSSLQQTHALNAIKGNREGYR